MACSATDHRRPLEHVGGQEIPVHRHALRIRPGHEACHQGDGTSNLLSSFSRPLAGYLYRRPNSTIPILQGEHRADTTIGGYTTQAQLRYLSRQVPSNPLPIGRVSRHTSEQQENAVPSAKGQDQINLLRNSCSLLQNRQQHFDGTEVLQPTQQASLLAKQCRHLSRATSLRSTSLLVCATYKDGMHLNSQVIEEMLCTAVVARSNASMVGQGNHLGTMPYGCHDQCFKFWLGRLMETIWPNRLTQGRGTRLLATDQGGSEQQCLRTLGVILMVKAALPSL